MRGIQYIRWRTPIPLDPSQYKYSTELRKWMSYTVSRVSPNPHMYFSKAGRTLLYSSRASQWRIGSACANVSNPSAKGYKGYKGACIPPWVGGRQVREALGGRW